MLKTVAYISRASVTNTRLYKSDSVEKSTKYSTRMKSLASGKCSSLFLQSISCEKNYKIDSGVFILSETFSQMLDKAGKSSQLITLLLNFPEHQ